MVIKVKYNGEWVKIPYLSSDHGRELVEEAPKDGSQYARQNGVWSVVNIPEVDFTEVYNAIATKVDKVEGKGLSTNDYVTADKTKVTNINEVVEAAAKNITATDISITLERDSNGYYLYRWDIQTEQRDEYIGYSYYEVTVWPTLTANKILETCINELWGTDVEAKKLNDYNAALLGILDESYIDIYKDFLQKRKELKEQVDSDFIAYEQMQDELNSGQITAIT